MLVFEDEEGIRTLLQIAFIKQNVRTESSGRAYLSIIQEFDPDVVLLDLNLPDLNGQLMLQGIKKHFPRLRVMVMSGGDALSDIPADVETWAKPFDVIALRNRVENFLKF